MEMTFHKLSSKLTMSSLWTKPNATRILFITMLSLKDDNGFVEGCDDTLMHTAYLTKDEYDAAMSDLMSPDPQSKCRDFEGRRVGVCEGGWVILSAGRYTSKEAEKKKKHNEYMKRYMAEKRAKDKERQEQKDKLDSWEDSINQTKGGENE
jgi:hypothetical protein